MFVLETARSAYGAGLSLLPVREDGTKAPDVSSWREAQTVRPTVESMQAFDFGHRVGIGMVAGVASGCRECWDFDDLDTYQTFVDTAASCGLGELVARVRGGCTSSDQSGPMSVFCKRDLSPVDRSTRRV